MSWGYPTAGSPAGRVVMPASPGRPPLASGEPDMDSRGGEVLPPQVSPFPPVLIPKQLGWDSIQPVSTLYITSEFLLTLIIDNKTEPPPA
jgi:hypothetical protein